MTRTRAWIAAISLGAGVAGIASLVASAPLLAVYAGGFWAIGAGLTVNNADSIPGLLRSDSGWGSGPRLWSGAFGGLSALAATGVMGPRIPVSADLAFVLGLFVVGVSVTMANVGTGLALALAE